MVYFVENETTDNIKIGFTTNCPEKRLQQLQTSCAESLKVIHVLPEGTLADEKHLHRQFGHLRLQREWFKLGLELERYLIDLDGGLGGALGDYIVAKATRKYWLEDRDLSPSEMGVKHFKEFCPEALAAYRKFKEEGCA